MSNMKRNLLLISAAATLGLAWPLAVLADPPARDGGGQAQSHGGEAHVGGGSHGGEAQGGGGAHSGGSAPRADQAHGGGSQFHGGQAQSQGGQTHGRDAPATQRAFAPSAHGPDRGSNTRVEMGRPTGEQVRAHHGASSPAQASGAFATTRDTPSGPGHRSPEIASLRRNVQSSHQFHVAAYQRPQGYSERHWGYGDRLPGAYYARNYWISDYLIYSLFAPPGGLVWVRVGDDALLIDEYSGEIIQVEYGVFY